MLDDAAAGDATVQKRPPATNKARDAPGAASGGALREHEPEGRRGLPRRRAAGPIAGRKRCRPRSRSRRGPSGRRKEGRQQDAPRVGAPPRRHQAPPGRRDATTRPTKRGPGGKHGRFRQSASAAV